MIVMDTLKKSEEVSHCFDLKIYVICKVQLIFQTHVKKNPCWLAKWHPRTYQYITANPFYMKIHEFFEKMSLRQDLFGESNNLNNHQSHHPSDVPMATINSLTATLFQIKCILD